MVEILVVIVIIGILFAVVLPRIDFASDKARITGVKTDLRQYIISAETYMRTTAGNNLSVSGFNEYLDGETQFQDIGDNTFGISYLTDPWGQPYELGLGSVDGDAKEYSMIIVASFGKGDSELRERYENEYGSVSSEFPDFVMAVYYIDGKIVTCTDGFGENDIDLSSEYRYIDVEICGGEIEES